jgi:hypothetical protein
LLTKVIRALRDLDEEIQSDNQMLAIELDTQFGSVGTIAGTRLGNIIQAYNEYSYKRYKMAAEIFWPRLQKVIGEDYRKLISDHKTKLDFAVTGISLTSIFLGLCLIGPFCYPSGQFWLSLLLSGVFILFTGYQIAIGAAYSLGQVIRSSYDLHRLDLLKKLKLEFPVDTVEERNRWAAYSRLCLYGDSEPLKLRDDNHNLDRNETE